MIRTGKNYKKLIWVTITKDFIFIVVKRGGLNLRIQIRNHETDNPRNQREKDDIRLAILEITEFK
jgi:hypothetical protein